MPVKNKKELAAAVRAICAVIILFASAALAAPNVPSINQVYQAARSGHLAQAEAMTKEVLRAYPDSARAHYVMAQILAAEGRTAEARNYFAEAERLKPGLPFANSQSVANLERRINGAARVPAAQPGTNQAFHWWWLLAGAVLLFILLRVLRARRPSLSGYSGSGMGSGGAGPMPGMPSAGYSGWGGGLLGSVLAGLGFGAGAAAGEQMVDRFLGREERETPVQPEIQELPSDSGNLGGDDFGVQSGDSSSGGWEDAGDQQSASPGPDDDFGTDGSDDDGGWDDSSGGGGDVNV
jgi:uncharacterized protein